MRFARDGWLEDYTAGVRGEPIGNITLVTRNVAGQAQHIVGNYRPRSTLLLLSRLIREKLAGTPYAGYFLAPRHSVSVVCAKVGIWRPSSR